MRVTSFDLDAAADVLLYNATTGSYYQGISRGPGAFSYAGGTWGPGRVIVATQP